MTEERPKVVLVAEDEPAVRKLVATSIRSLGCLVLESPDAEQALGTSQWHMGPIDLLITDVKMPGLSGKHLAEKLCEARPGIAVLYISGYTEYDIKDLIKCGNQDGRFLQKSFSVSTLVAKVKSIFAVS